MLTYAAPLKIIAPNFNRPHDTTRKSNIRYCPACVALTPGLEKLVKRTHLERMVAELQQEAAAHGHA